MGDREIELDKGHTILNELIDVCMLVRSLDGCVVMHDLIRDLTIGITRKSPRFVVRSGIGLTGSIGVEEFTEEADKISLMRNQIRKLSGQPNCPKLSTLLLQCNPLSGNIPQQFFNRMKCLQVLNLSYTGIKYVPASVSNLEDLHALSLNGCMRLREVPSLAKLKRLRHLDLSGTNIKYVPALVSSLENLSLLLLNDCKRLMEVMSLANLKHVGHLDISGTAIEYMPESVSDSENLSELLLNGCRRLRKVPSLAKLKHLRLLDLSNTCIKELPHGMECLVELRELYVGSEEWVDLDFDRYVKSGHWKCLKLGHLSSRSGFFALKTDSVAVVNCNLIGQESSLVLPDSIVKLNMERCHLSSLPCLSRLLECDISLCSMKWLLPIGENSTITSFPLIQSLCLSQLPNFRGLCEGIWPPGSFACLRRLIVHGCHVLENLMSLELFQHLHCLQELKIEECSEMEEVIGGEGDDNNNNNTILLPNLKLFILRYLGKLKSICKQVIIRPSLDVIHIVGCPRLKKIPLSLCHSTSDVEGEMEGSKEWWDALEWDDPNTKTLLLPLFTDREVERR